MATPIKVPHVGMTAEQNTLLRWLKKERQAVKKGEVLAEIEADKVTVELESTADGVLIRTLVAEGEEVRPGDIIAYVGPAVG